MFLSGFGLIKSLVWFDTHGQLLALPSAAHHKNCICTAKTEEGRKGVKTTGTDS